MLRKCGISTRTCVAYGKQVFVSSLATPIFPSCHHFSRSSLFINGLGSRCLCTVSTRSETVLAASFYKFVVLSLTVAQLLCFSSFFSWRQHTVTSWWKRWFTDSSLKFSISFQQSFNFLLPFDLKSTAALVASLLSTNQYTCGWDILYTIHALYVISAFVIQPLVRQRLVFSNGSFIDMMLAACLIQLVGGQTVMIRMPVFRRLGCI